MEDKNRTPSPVLLLIVSGLYLGLTLILRFTRDDIIIQQGIRFYRTLNALKHSRPELAAGTQGAPMTRYATANPNIYIFERDLDGSRTIVGVNLGTDEQPIHFTGAKPALSNATDIFTGASATLPSTLAPGAYFIFTANK